MMVNAQLRCAERARRNEALVTEAKPEKQPAAINHINHRTGTTMQLFSFIPRYFARRKAVADLREQCDEARRGNSETATLLMGMRQESCANHSEVQQSIERVRSQLDKWGREGMPRTGIDQEVDELFSGLKSAMAPWDAPGMAESREKIIRACEFINAGRAKEYAKDARAAAGLPVDANDVCTDAPVFDADHDLQITGILGVNSKAGWVLVADLPVVPNEYGHIKSRRIRFSSIIEFKPNDQGSGSFHCYGRLPE